MNICLKRTFCTSVGSIGFLYSNSSPTLNDMSMGMMLDLKEKQWNGPSVLMHNMALLSAIILSASPDGAPVIWLTMNKIMSRYQITRYQKLCYVAIYWNYKTYFWRKFITHNCQDLFYSGIGNWFVASRHFTIFFHVQFGCLSTLLTYNTLKHNSIKHRILC